MQVRQLLSYARPYRGTLLAMVALTTASSLVLLAVPWLAGGMLGSIIGGSATAERATIVVLALCLAAIALLNFTTAYHAASATARMLADLRQSVYEHVQRLPMAFHDASATGDILALMTFEIRRLSLFLTGTLVAIPARLLTTVGAIVLMFRIDARLALIVPLLIPAFYLVLKIIGRRLRSLAISLQRAEAEVVWRAEESLEILPAIKAFTREAAQAEQYRAANREVLALSVKESRIYAALEPLIGFLAALAALAILWLAGHHVEAGRMTSAELFSFMFYAALLTKPVGALAQVYGQVQTARGTLRRLQQVFEEPRECSSSASEILPQARGDIRFEDVKFAYTGRKPTLSGVNLHVRSGETVALVGPNGAGKTAIINLLMRFYEPAAGKISIDGCDIAKLELSQLRRQIGLVPQTPFLFNGTIRDNIAFGADHPTLHQIDEAARLAQASEFIDALPDGMDTPIGDRGLRLSGGQRQRIALARALIKDPPILVLDEATSMFDADGESAFIATCVKALKDRTVILVTHRPATLAVADRTVVVEEGRVSEGQSSSRRLTRAS